jgi:hypothetical protein
MNWRTNFFRAWVLVSTLWVLGCIAVLWSADKNKFHWVSFGTNDRLLILAPPIIVLVFVGLTSSVLRRLRQ